MGSFNPFLLQKPSSLLAYPAGVAPGFDPTQVAAKGAYQSAICISGGFFCLLTGNIYSNTIGPFGGSLTPVILSGLGPAIKYANVIGSSSGTVYPTALLPNITLALVVQMSDLSASYSILGNSLTDTPPTTGNNAIFISSAGNIQLINHFAGFDSGASSISAGVPYFIAVSASSALGLINFVSTNLMTGKVATQSISAAFASTGSNGRVIIGSDQSGQRSDSSISHTMISANYLSIQQLRQWAADPWSFWYPRRARSFVGVTAGGSSFIPAWAIPSNPQVIGAY